MERNEAENVRAVRSLLLPVEEFLAFWCWSDRRYCEGQCVFVVRLVLYLVCFGIDWSNEILFCELLVQELKKVFL